MKKLLLLLIIGVCFNLNSITAQTIDDFNYSGYLISNGWSAHSGSGTNSIATTTGLTFSGYVNSGIGNAALVGNGGGEDVNYTAGVGPYSSNGDVVYLSFMVNVTETGSKTGDYFLHLGNRTSESSFSYFAARVFAKVTSGVVNFGISNTSTATYGSTNFAANTTYLIVVKYIINTGGSDEVDMWVLPSGVPASEAGAGTAEVSSTTTTGQDVINAIALRQGSSSTSVQTVVDGIRIASTWEALLPVSSSNIPTASAATNVTSASFTANWSSVSSAASYLLDVSTASDFSSFVADFNAKDVGNVTSYEVTSLTPNTTYYYRVRSTDGTTISSYSGTITAGTLVLAPNALEATNITGSDFTANWETVAGASSYKLDVSTLSDFSTFVSGYDNLDVGNVVSYTVASLNAGQTYYYRVRGYNSNGSSASSNIITITTSAVAAPVALDPTNITTDGFTANWSYSGEVLNYYLDISAASDFSTFVSGYEAKEITGSTYCAITSLSSSVVYYYRLRAVTSAGVSANSNIITVTTLIAAPVAIQASSITSSGFTAKWNASNGATNYWLDVSTVSDFSTILASYDNKSTGNVTSYNVTGLNASTVYYYRVCASNSAGSSPYSNTITVSTVVTGVKDGLSAVPTSYDLYQNYPNPFNPSTIIKYQIPESGYVTIKVYDMLGCEICTLVSENKSAGVHQVKFNGKNLTSGMYLYKIQAGNYMLAKKMTLMK